MNIRLWEPSSKTKKNSNLFKFEKFISKRFNKNFNENFKKIHDWSVKNQGDFWSSVWDFSKVKGIKRNTKVKKSKKFYKNFFLPNSRLNFCENLLSKNTKEKAITFISENGYREIRNWNELNKNVKNISNNFKKIHDWSVRNQGDFLTLVLLLIPLTFVKSHTLLQKSPWFLTDQS